MKAEVNAKLCAKKKNWNRETLILKKQLIQYYQNIKTMNKRIFFTQKKTDDLFSG